MSDIKRPDLHLVSPGEKAPRVRKDYTPRLSKIETIAMLGLTDAEAQLCTLTDEEMQFVCAMISNGCDKYKAYSTAYKTEGKLTQTQYNKIAEIIRKDEVRQLLRKGIQRKMSESLDNLDSKLLDVYISRAFYDPSDIFYDNGESRPLSDIDEKYRCVIDGIETRYFGRDGDVRSVLYKLANRDQALKVLSDYMQNIRPSSGIIVTSAERDTEEDEMSRLEDMSYEELQEEMRKLRQA